MKLIIQNTIQFFFNPKVFKFILLLGLVYLLYNEILKLPIEKGFLKDTLQQIHWGYLWLGLLLVLPNYYFEFSKWKLLRSHIQLSNFSTAANEVLRGLRLGIFTPLMIGDYYGRAKDFPSEYKTSAYYLNFYNSIIQTWTALLLGALALGLWSTMDARLLAPCMVLSVFSFIGLLFIYGLQPSFFKRWKFTQKFLPPVSLTTSTKNQVIIQSIIRNLIYNLQYICIYKAFQIVLGSKIYFIGINTILLLKTVGGGLNVLGDLSIRELVSLNYFRQFDVDQRLILFATFVVWFINIFIPIILGMLYRPKK